MNVKELKELLSVYDDTLRVLVSGYESGYDDIGEVDVISVRMQTDCSACEGDYKPSDDTHSTLKGPEFKALLLLK